MNTEEKVRRQVGILSDLGYRCEAGSVVLDLGCGNGGAVASYRRRGCEAFGCDFAFKPGEHVAELAKDNLIRLVGDSPYRLPFPDDTFDFVLSDQVFEHVQDYASTVAEISRVLKPHGVALHIFPSRYSLIEPHVKVPLAAWMQQRWWLCLWARLGVRNESQRGLTSAEVAEQNFSYLHQHTNYLPRHAIRKQFMMKAERVEFCERYFIKHNQRSGKAKVLHNLSKVLPIVPYVYSLSKMLVLFSVNQKSS